MASPLQVDRKRNFSLPRIEDLSKEQELTLALPIDGPHLIVGGPGTGKSVVALLRARRLTREKRPYLFLVYNHLLNYSNIYLFGGQERLLSATWDSWFRKLWKQRIGISCPLLEPAPNGYRPIDWETVKSISDEYDTPTEAGDLPYLVIDEGQDMPPGFYTALINFGFENFYILADQNQSIHPDRNSSRKDLENFLGLNASDTIELTFNYRNTHSIARLARAFYPEDPASPPPLLPSKTQDELIPRMITYGPDRPNTAESIVERILQICDRDWKKSIGIIVAREQLRKDWVRKFEESRPQLEHPKVPIGTYSSYDQVEIIDFSCGGITIINAHSCKGLEFDYLFLVDIDKHWLKGDALKALFYVMVARARERVFLLHSGDFNNEVEAILPDDAEILERR